MGIRQVTCPKCGGLKKMRCPDCGRRGGEQKTSGGETKWCPCPYCSGTGMLRQQYKMRGETGAMWEKFKRRLESKDVVLIRQAKQLVDLPPSIALQQFEGLASSMDAKTLRELWAILSLIQKRAYEQLAGAAKDLDERLTQQPMVSGAEEDLSCLGQEGEEISHGLMTVARLRARFETCVALCEKLKRFLSDQGQTLGETGVVSLPKIELYVALMKRVNACATSTTPHQWSPETVERLQNIREEFERLLKVDPADYLYQDIQEAIASIWEGVGDFAYGALKDGEKARIDYEQAISIYDDDEIGLPKAADQCRLKIAKIVLSQEANFDNAIQRLRPILDQFPRERKSLEHATALLQLAQTYTAIGDAYEAGKCLDEIESELTALKYHAPDREHPEQSLSQWMDTAERLSATSEEFEKALLDVVTLYAGIFTARSRMEKDSGIAALQQELASRLNLLVEELIEVGDEVILQNSRERAEFSQELGKEGEAYAPLSEKREEGPNSFRVLAALDRRLGALRAEIEQRMTTGQAMDELLPKAQQIEVEARRWSFLSVTGTAMLLQSDILLSAGRYHEAIALVRTALQLPRAEEQQMTTGLWALDRIATAYIALKDHQAISDTCGQAIDLIERHRYNVTAPYLQSSYLHQRVRFYSLGVISAYRLGDYTLMLERAELSKARATLRYLGDLSTSLPREQLDQQFQEVCQQVDAGRGSLAPDEIDRLLVKRRTLWDLRMIRRAQANTGQRLPAFSLEAVQAVLDGDEAVVYYYWLAPTVLLVVGIDQQEIVVEKLDISEEEREALEAFANFILSLKQSAYTYLDEVQQFSALLLPEKVKLLLEKKQKVIFSPHRLLHTIPFHALKWNDDYFIHRFAVSYTPNISSLLVTYAPTSSQGVLALGIQDFAVPGEKLNSLKAAELEAEILEKLYNSQAITIDVLKGPMATKQILQQWNSEEKLEQFKLLHFATHGADVRGDTPLESYLFLQDGRLDGLEIADWRLNAELVVLSACHSGQRAIAGRGMTELPGDEIFGLQVAFFMAGARRVVGALWPAESKFACEIMTDFHRHLVAGKLPEIALQEAMTGHLKNASRQTKKIYYWAPFFISAIGCPSGANAILMSSRGTPDQNK